MHSIPTPPGQPSDYGGLFTFVVCLIIFVLAIMFLIVHNGKTLTRVLNDHRKDRERSEEVLERIATESSTVARECASSLATAAAIMAGCPHNKMHRKDQSTSTPSS
jgi:energy-converting hydrogenase Eha subunit H